MKLFLPLLIVGVAAMLHSTVGQRNQVLTPDLQKFMQLITSLKYGDQCSWENEEGRQNFTKQMSRMPLTSMSQILQMRRFQLNVLKENKTYCSASEQFICDQDTQRCVCGDPGKKVLFPDFDVSSEYVVEEDEDGTQRCNWKEGSYCLSDDIFRAARQSGLGDLFHMQCASGTRCTSKVDGEDCSFHALVSYILRTYSFRATRNQQQIIKDLFNGKVCTCQPDPAINTIGSDSDEPDTFNEVRYRTRRAVQEQQQIMKGEGEDELMGALLSPIFANF